ncbi:hypothetical protein AB0N17_35170 [Streptomyces sp. NPDC051133]|uniref:WXG100 family type VII secretion target n=1 Tax=Streptomyces sp. NPDC051133 TaxID=3155521 RepID=UPI0034236A0E
MSDNWQKQPQYKTGLEQANVESVVANTVGGVKNLLRGTPLGSTQFDDADLNAMIDLVEHANPEHLELAGKALWDARDAVSRAATDLTKNIRAVLADWEGDGADQFETWTNSLLDYTKRLETYAHVAGTQISTAATGLASVRKSMPPRDTRPAAEQKRPTELPHAKQVDSNSDFVLAKQVEKNRQDAINQMVRLGSFYSVAASGLQSNPEPKPIKAIPDVGVALPKGGRDVQRHAYSPETSTPTAAVRRSVEEGHSAAPVAHGSEPGGGVPPLKEVHEPSVHAGHEVGTEINTVGTLPPPAHTTPSVPPAPTLPNAGGGGQTLPLPPGPMTPPIAPTVGRSTGYGPSNRLPISAQGRTGPSGTARGRVPQEPEGQSGRTVSGGRGPQGPTGQAARAMGRTTSAGQSAVRGSTQQTGRSPMGRGITGGTPRTSNTPGGRAGTSGPIGAARNGVMGGKPVTGRSPGATSNPRVPRGMVVGAEEPVSSTQPKGALGQRGVVGAPTAKTEAGTSQSVLRSASNPEGAIGAPRNAAGSKSGGAENGAREGLGRGTVGNRQNANGETGGAGAPSEKRQHRPQQKQRRDVPDKRD